MVLGPRGMRCRVDAGRVAFVACVRAWPTLKKSTLKK